MPMGPIELADVVGLDVAAHVGEIIARELGRPAPELPRLAALLAAKKLGRKSGEGFYVWQDGKPREAAAAARRRRRISIDRLILVLVNECVACLRERVVDDADLVDAAVIFGTGFAPFRGGPLSLCPRARHRRPSSRASRSSPHGMVRASRPTPAGRCSRRVRKREAAAHGRGEVVCYHRTGAAPPLAAARRTLT